ncbi:response regulator transcription factor [Emcibacter nanhaiensis]|uniref:Response regulator transcription factor n=1 Tax=Emcibacter nanhaiensis TaxID=1505037 RepID=A0A501PCJ8_9PROT|nr:response regulator transcription factor [Emcibacter nanhaiensis]TPD57686.1 response regulator transcription factor [Emcibacter nanhaiensis]
MRTLLIDEFDICRDGMKMLLLETFSEPEVSEARSIEEGLDILSEQQFDLIMIDLDSVNLSYTDLLKPLVPAAGAAPIITLAHKFTPEITAFAMRTGVAACMIKVTPKQMGSLILKMVMAGGRYFPPETLGGDEQQTKICPVNFDKESCPLHQETPLMAPEITRRQLEVLKCIAKGKTNKMIAREMGISAGTVKVHVASILKLFNANNRTQAVNIAIHMKLI